MSLPTDCHFTQDHEWVREEKDGLYTIGISDYAQAQLGDVVFVDLPAVGRVVQRGDTFGSVESVKAVSDLFAPLGGEVVEVNSELVDHPELVNRDPFGGAWMIKVRADGAQPLAALLDAAAYSQLLGAG